MSFKPSLWVDSQVRRGADEIRLRIVEVTVDLAEQAEDAQQRVLHEVLDLPDIVGQPTALALQNWPEWCEQVEIAPPRAADFTLHGKGGVRIWKGHFVDLNGPFEHNDRQATKDTAMADRA